MTFNRVKLGRSSTFMNYFITVVSLIFLPKTLILNKSMFPASNSPNIAEQVENKQMKCISRKLYQYFFFYLIYRCLFQRFSELITKELDNFSKILISIVVYHELPVEFWG